MIRVIACGKCREKWTQLAIEEYAKRIRGYEKLELVEVKDEKAEEKNSDAQNGMVKQVEGERLLKQIQEDEFVILLDLKGKELDSVGLEKKIQQLYLQGKSKITFVIGGSLGVSDALIQRANFRWKLSVNTFPHQLCRVIVLEQIYRACKIARNEPYHK